MKKSLATLRLTEINRRPYPTKGCEWRTPTIEKYNDNIWTVRCIFLEDLTAENTAKVEVQCFYEAEPFIHVIGKKIDLFTGIEGNKPYKCELEIIKEIL
jgi:hypothetical protein